MFRFVFFAFSIVALVAGCGKRIPELGTVSGVVKLDGKILDEIRVEFMPDPEKGNMAELSFGESDSTGAYSLSYSGLDDKKGAAIGHHRVVLWDYKSINSREDPKPARFGDKFNLASTTPIHVEVKNGDQQIEIDLTKFK